jgi:hypothetical protein
VQRPVLLSGLWANRRTRPDSGISVSIHVYEGNSGAIRRSVFDPVMGWKNYLSWVTLIELSPIFGIAPIRCDR